MASNLRSKPITGHVTDGAGNVIRNSSITIKSFTPISEIVVDTTITNDDGLFVSAPLPTGSYAIFDSGVLISNILHTADADSIPALEANSVNVGSKTLAFRALIDNGDINDYKVYVQLEDPSINISRYGSTYPLFDRDIKDHGVDWYGDLASFHDLTVDSRITTTRFDIEYYNPLTKTSKTYKRVRWAGVPAIKYSRDSRLVLPLDYYSIIPTNPKYYKTEVDAVTSEDNSYVTINSSTMDAGATIVGDIIKLEWTNNNDEELEWYGINVEESLNSIKLVEWKSSLNSENIKPVVNDIKDSFKVYIYDGMTQGMSNLGGSTNEKISIVENVSAQNSLTELYNYNNG